MALGVALVVHLLWCAVPGATAVSGLGGRGHQQLLTSRDGRAEVEVAAGAGTTTNIEECITQLDNGWKLVDLSKFRFAAAGARARTADPDKSGKSGGGGDGGRPDESLKDITGKILAAAQAELAQTGISSKSSSSSSSSSSRGGSPPPTSGESSPEDTSSSTSGDKPPKVPKSSPSSSSSSSDTGSDKPPPPPPKPKKSSSDDESSGSGGDKKEEREDKKDPSSGSGSGSSSSSGSGGGGGSGFTIGSGYVVTLTNHPSRLQHAEAMAAKYPELKLSILPAVNKDSPQATVDWYPLARGIKLAEKACAQSHIAAIKRVAEAGTRDTELHFIFEDDVQLVPDFLEKFTNYFRATFADGRQPFDIINLWRMPPRMPVATLSAHFMIPDGWWGMQGYVMTSKGAEKVLGCVSKRFAQVDEMIGCCAAPAPESATFTGGPLLKHSTRCVYNTPRPEGLSTNVQAFVLQPNLLTHMTSDFKSTAHTN